MNFGSAIGITQGKMPDLLLPFRGFYLVIEAEVDDQLQAQEQAWRKAVERVEQGLAHLALALVYPAALRELPPRPPYGRASHDQSSLKQMQSMTPLRRFSLHAGETYGGGSKPSSAGCSCFS